MKKLVAPILIASALLSGCSSSGQPASTPTPTPTVAEATPQEVASVIAQYKTDWQEVVDGAIECRTTWALDTDPVGKIKGASCYLREQTIGTTATLVLRDWSKLEIPTSMSSLVGKTRTILQGIANIDLKAVCGADVVPANTDQCNSALGSRNFLYTSLKTQLGAWSPYL